MNWPVSRSRYDEVVGDLRTRVAELEKERKRIYDAIFKHQFGIQIFDTLQADEPTQPEPVLSKEEQEVAEAESRDSYRKAKLTSIARTNPSQLAPAIAQMMVQKTTERAKAAHPSQTVFAEAKVEALKN